MTTRIDIAQCLKQIAWLPAWPCDFLPFAVAGMRQKASGKIGETMHRKSTQKGV